MGRYAKVTENKFKAVKILLASGATHNECADSMGLGVSTVGTINRSETYEEYRNATYIRSAYVRKKMREAAESANEDSQEDIAPAVDESEKEEQNKDQQTQIVEHRQTVTIQATHYMMEEMRKTNELLALISNKLAFIVDELTR